MEIEFQALLTNNSWKLVPSPKHGKILDKKWVCKTKLELDKTLDKYKTRVVTKKFQ